MRSEEISAVVTAGFAASPAAVALAQLLLRERVRVCGIMIVTPFQIARAKALLRSRGFKALKQAASRAMGAVAAPRLNARTADPVENLFQSEKLRRISLPAFAKQNGIPCKSFRDLNSREAIAFLRAVNPAGVAYCGGGILRKPFLSAVGGKVLNAHAGPLPEVRGMNAAEWSVLLNLPAEVTIHFIDAGVDTGPVVARLPIPLEPGDTIETLRLRAVAEGVRGLLRHIDALAGPIPPKDPSRAQHKQVFVLAPALRELAEWRLSQRLQKAPLARTFTRSLESNALAW